MPDRFIWTTWPGEYGPKLVIDFLSLNSSRRRA